MRERKNPRKFIIATGATLAALLMAGCSDGPTAPMGAAAPSSTRNSLSGILSVSTVGGTTGDTTVTVFQVNPFVKQSFVIASVHKITFTAYSICDLSLSSYGPGTWDSACVPQLLPVTITAKSWTDASGHPRVDFAPSMRFNPNAEPVILWLRDRNALSSGLGINYCPDGATECVDESLTDPSLTTYRNPTNGFYYRRIKHFSGYNISLGWSSESSAME